MCRYITLFDIIISSLCISVIISCSAQKHPDYPTFDFNEYQYSIEKYGFKIVADPIFESQKNKKYFGTNLYKKNLLPIYISVENTRSKGIFLVTNNKINLNIFQNKINATKNHFDAGGSTGAAICEVSAVLVSTPLMFVGLNQMSNAAEIERNFISKKLQTETLSPGEKISGFVYFQVPKKVNQEDKAFISIDIQDLANKTFINFKIPVNWEGGS